MVTKSSGFARGSAAAGAGALGAPPAQRRKAVCSSPNPVTAPAVPPLVLAPSTGRAATQQRGRRAGWPLCPVCARPTRALLLPGLANAGPGMGRCASIVVDRGEEKGSAILHARATPASPRARAAVSCTRRAAGGKDCCAYDYFTRYVSMSCMSAGADLLCSFYTQKQTAPRPDPAHSQLVGTMVRPHPFAPSVESPLLWFVGSGVRKQEGAVPEVS